MGIASTTIAGGQVLAAPLDHWQSLKIAILPPAARGWLATSRARRVLHVFERSCNLIDDRGDVLSVVAPEIGNGPFNAVLETVPFALTELVGPESRVAVRTNGIALGRIAISAAFGKTWYPAPDWTNLHMRRAQLAHRLLGLIGPERPRASRPRSPGAAHTTRKTSCGEMEDAALQYLDFLAAAVASCDLAACGRVAARLAGLGSGLTPAGDDLLVGALYAGWIRHPSDRARNLAAAVAASSVHRTTALSAAWLSAAARGEAGQAWHTFFEALLSGDSAQMEAAFEELLSVGHTSGADGLTGFIAAMTWGRHQRVEHVVSSRS